MKYMWRIARMAIGGQMRHEPCNDVQLQMVRRFTLVEQLALFEVALPYRMCEYQPGQETAWIRFMNDTHAFGVWDRQKLLREIVERLVPGGGFFTTAERGIVGCVSACHLKKYLPYSTLMYAVVDPKERGKGIGKAMLCAALRASQRAGYAGMVLNTDDFRLPAIRTYLSVGFEPHRVSELNHAKRWQAVLGKLESTAPEESPVPRVTEG
jgi:mycothiol synthase